MKRPNIVKGDIIEYEGRLVEVVYDFYIPHKRPIHKFKLKDLETNDITTVRGKLVYEKAVIIKRVPATQKAKLTREKKIKYDLAQKGIRN